MDEMVMKMRKDCVRCFFPSSRKRRKKPVPSAR